MQLEPKLMSMKDGPLNIDQFFTRYEPLRKFKNPVLFSIFASIIFSPFVTALILVSYTIHFNVPIVDVASAVSDVYFHINIIAFLLLLILLLFIMLPALVSLLLLLSTKPSRLFLGENSSSAARMRNAYLIYRPFPNRYSKNRLHYCVRSNLSLGSILVYGIIFYLFISYFDSHQISEERAWLYIISPVLYFHLTWLSIYNACIFCKQMSERRIRLKNIPLERRRFQRTEYWNFFVTVNFFSIPWTLIIYQVALSEFGPHKEENIIYSIFLVIMPIAIFQYYNLIAGHIARNFLSMMTFSLLVVVFLLFVWPGTEKFPRGVFHVLGISGEIPVEIAIFSSNSLGLPESVSHERNESSGSVYPRVLGPLHLILYGKDKIYVRTIRSHQCMSDQANELPPKPSCRRIFSIPQKYIASVDLTKNANVVQDSAR